MLQRFQSLFLLLAAACYIWAAFLPIATLQPQDLSGREEWSRVEEEAVASPAPALYTYDAWAVRSQEGEKVCNNGYLALLQLLLGGFSLVIIFLYKNRKLQSKLCVTNLFVGLLLLVLMLFVCPDMIFPKVAALRGAETVYSLWTLVSMLPVLLVYVAQKFILRDERLVRSADRLR